MPDCGCQHPKPGAAVAVRYKAWTLVEWVRCLLCGGLFTRETERDFDREDAWQ